MVYLLGKLVELSCDETVLRGCCAIDKLLWPTPRMTWVTVFNANADDVLPVAEDAACHAIVVMKRVVLKERVCK
jgi:hypothetical protein